MRLARWLGAFVLLAAVATPALLLLVRPDGGPSATPSARQSLDPDAVVWGAAPIGPADPDPWQSATWEPLVESLDPAGDPQFRVDGVIDAGDLIIAWGKSPMPGRNQFNDIGSVFVSADGREWQTVPIVHGVNAASTSEILGVAVSAKGLLAFGGVCCEPESRAVWLSADGVTWTRQPIQGALDPGGAYFVGGVGTHGGWALAGNDVNGESGAVWTSADGANWELGFSAEDGMPGLTVSDVAAGPDGLFAVGTVTGPDGSYDGAIWTSVDGAAWERTVADEPTLVGAGEVVLHSVVTHANGVLVTGIFGTTEDRQRCEQLGAVAGLEAGPPVAISCGFGTEHLWIGTDDGWRRVDPAAALAEHPIEFRVIRAGGPGLVLLGESSGDASPDTALYVSRDGVAWTLVGPLQPIATAVAHGLVVRGREVLAITSDFDGNRNRFAVWHGSID